MANGLRIELNTVGFGDQLATLEHDRIFNKTNYLHSFVLVSIIENLKYIFKFEPILVSYIHFNILFPVYPFSQIYQAYAIAEDCCFEKSPLLAQLTLFE